MNQLLEGKLYCVNGTNLNKECLSGNSFEIQFYSVFGLLMAVCILIPLMLAIFIAFTVRFCRNDKEIEEFRKKDFDLNFIRFN